MKLELLFEDKELVVWNKPTGLPSTRHVGQDSGTAVHLALESHPHLPFKNSLERGLLHRLDTETSGALAFAKTEKAHERFRSIWNESVKKTYRAQSIQSTDRILQPPLEVNLEIGHDAKSSRKMRVLDPSLPISLHEQLRRIRGRAQSAQTTIVKVTTLPHQILDFEIEIKTGVMHQIRAHLAHLSFSIIGDSLYRGQPSTRLWLHAWKLQIEDRLIEAPLPENWLTAK